MNKVPDSSAFPAEDFKRWSEMFKPGDRVRVKPNGMHPGRTGTISNFAYNSYVIWFDGVQPPYPLEDPFTIEKIEGAEPDYSHLPPDSIPQAK